MESEARPKRTAHPTPKVKDNNGIDLPPTPFTNLTKRANTLNGAVHGGKRRRRVIANTQATQPLQKDASPSIASSPPAASDARSEAHTDDDDLQLFEEDSEIAEIDISDTSVLDYRATWRVIVKEKEKAVKTHRLNGVDDGYGAARSYGWQTTGLDWKIMRMKARVYYDGLAPKKHFVTDIELASDYDTLIQQAMEHYYLDKCDNIAIDLMIYMEKDPIFEASQPAVNNAATAGPSSQRATATTRQLAHSRTTIEALEAGGDKSYQLRLKWTCTANDCPQSSKQGHCYWRGTNSAVNHLPITQSVLEAWTRALKEERLTADEPDFDIFALLAKGLRHSECAYFNHKKQQQSALYQQQHIAPGTTLNIFNGITADGAIAQIQQQQPPQTASDNLPSSQVTETPALKLYLAFFNDMAKSPK